MHTILVVDDDPTVAEVVTAYLERAGFRVDRAADGPEALRLAEAHAPALVVLDLMLPGMNGLDVCRRLRERGPVPVIMLTALGGEDDRILGLEIGADDYVTKPFSPRELVLRVESVLRRGHADQTPATEPPLRLAGITLDRSARSATRNGRALSLTLREFELLAHLIRHPGVAIGREQLMHDVWGWEFGDLSTVTVHVRRLRGKIEDDPARPRLIRTVWGVGYRFDVPDGPDLPDGTGLRDARDRSHGTDRPDGTDLRDGAEVRDGADVRDEADLRGGAGLPDAASAPPDGAAGAVGRTGAAAGPRGADHAER